jgi:hypothetical protein
VTGRRIKQILLLGGIAVSGLVFLGWTQPWFTVVVTEGPTLSVAGDVAAPALSTLALTCLVLVGALTIAGPFFRVVLGALQTALGATIVLSGVLALVDPVKASSATISDATGIAGNDSIHALVASVAVSAWPWVSTVAGGLLAALGLAVAVTGRRWPGSSRKYSAVKLEPEAPRSAVDDWDSLSDGSDPTSR